MVSQLDVGNEFQENLKDSSKDNRNTQPFEKSLVKLTLWIGEHWAGAAAG